MTVNKQGTINVTVPVGPGDTVRPGETIISRTTTPGLRSPRTVPTAPVTIRELAPPKVQLWVKVFGPPKGEILSNLGWAVYQISPTKVAGISGGPGIPTPSKRYRR